MDEMVLEVQKWVNKTYSGVNGYNPVTENGKTGWSTIYALTRGLQIELGITALADNFGPTTAAKYREWGEMKLGQVPTDQKGINITKILQGSMYCKGYNPTGFTGTFGEGTKAAVVQLQSDANVPTQDGKVYDYIFKAFLTMDAFVLTVGGDPRIRDIQRSLNYNYYTTSGVQPCDGHYQRGTNKALVFGIQTEQGIAPADQTGTVGPTTTSLLPVLTSGSQGNFVRLFQYALYVNGYDAGVFDGVYGSGVKETVKGFQSFVRLSPVDGIAGKQTWLSLLVSTGDPSRIGTACDCITEVTSARAQTLKAEGYKTVGRYLTNVDGGLNKKIQPGELSTIFAAGLAVFPIYQTTGNKASAFSAVEGEKAAKAAFSAASAYGFKPGVTIYFAVDFDALDDDITNNILPHFKAIHNYMKTTPYQVGVYGARNVCIRVGNAGYSINSFVSGMSTGFSGNLGYRLPEDWAFDQISTRTIGSGAGQIEIDNNIQSGRDLGTTSVHSGFDAELEEVYQDIRELVFANNGYEAYIKYREKYADKVEEQRLTNYVIMRYGQEFPILTTKHFTRNEPNEWNKNMEKGKGNDPIPPSISKIPIEEKPNWVQMGSDPNAASDDENVKKEIAKKARYHQFNRVGTEPNTKYIFAETDEDIAKQSGHREVIFYSDGKRNDTPEDRGSFNYGKAIGGIGAGTHNTEDVFPYLLLGNAPDDSTMLLQRLKLIKEW